MVQANDIIQHNGDTWRVFAIATSPLREDGKVWVALFSMTRTTPRDFGDRNKPDLRPAPVQLIDWIEP